MTGKTISHYRVQEKIGAGGMGTVYRATDTKLSRDVALKVLPEEFAKDHDRMARFKREAQVLASLNHHNIAAIYGLEQEGEIQAISMELVEGPTLAERIKAGALAVEEALGIAKQIAEALESAHEQGVIHRDLKPANVKVKEDGTVKVLDFGLAKALEGELSDEDIADSPTLSVAATRAGVILGTAAYMSPEQAAGKTADRRADVWSFGVVLFEMLTGLRLFVGDSAVEVMSRVMRDEPDWGSLPAATPAAIRKLLARCLAKDRKRRLHAIADARLEIEDAIAHPQMAASADAVAPAREQPWRKFLPWAAAVGVLGMALGAWTLGFLRTRELPPVMRLTFPVNSGFGLAAISPDGKQLAYSDVTDQTTQGSLYVRQLDSTASRQLAGLSASRDLTWSPDGQEVALSNMGSLLKVNVQTEQTQVLADLAVSGRRLWTQGIAWSNDGRILFGGGSGPLYQVPASGGEPTPVTTLDTAREEVAHIWPQFLPDDRHFIFLVQSRVPENTGIYVGSLDSPEKQLLVKTSVKARFAPPGYLLFVREGTLLAQQMDTRAMRLNGEPSPVANEIGTFAAYGSAHFWTSETGVLVYLSAQFLNEDRELLWFDRAGMVLDTVGEPAPGFIVNLSRDESHAASMRYSGGITQDGNIWVTDLERNVSTPFNDKPSLDTDPQWSPDGKQIAFSSDRNGQMALFLKSVEGSPTEPLYASDSSIFMCDWSSDGRYVIYHQGNTRFFGLPMFGDREPVLVLDTPSRKDQAQFAPNTRWIAYNADNSGRFEVYVTSFPEGGEEIRVSSDGGVQPRWRADGRELFYLDPEGRLMSVEVRETGDRIEFGIPKQLFQSRVEPMFGVELYDVTRDGKRFIMMVPVETESLASQANVVVNWPSVLPR